MSHFTSPTIHIGVVVADLARSLRFYTELIGMSCRSSFDVSPQVAGTVGLTDGRPLHVEVLALGEGEHATQWKLMSFGGDASPPPADYIHSAAGMRYTTLYVAALAPVLRRLAAAGWPLQAQSPIEVGEGRFFALVKDPDGIFVELIGPMGE